MNAGRVLIVDDDEDIQANFADILQEFGYQTTTAGCGQSALEMIREADFDVVLLDYQMPGMDGATLYDEIKKLRPSIAAIMVTAWAGSDGAKRAKEAGTWEVMRKPVNIGELLAKVKTATSAPVILVVDDDQSFCQMLWQLLNERKFRVALAHSEDEGIRRIADADFQIAIVDLKLGEGDGIKVIERIQDSVPSTKTFLISGNVSQAIDKSKLLDEKVIEAVLEKPLRMDSLLKMIE